MTAIDLTARGSGYYVVYVNDVQFSRHTAEREAIERCTDVLASDPAVKVYYSHDYVVDAVVSGGSAQIPDMTSDAPLSDGGEDLF